MIWVYMGIFVVMQAARDIPDEITGKTIDLLLSKPIKRHQIILGKILAHVILTTMAFPLIYIVIVLGSLDQEETIYYGRILLGIIDAWMLIVSFR